MEEQTEVTRRLKIQNKKLLEQVVSLRKRLKKNNAEKAKIRSRLNYFKKIINSLSETFGSCPRCGEKILFLAPTSNKGNQSLNASS